MVLWSWLWCFTSSPSSSVFVVFWAGWIYQQPKCDQIWLPEPCLALLPDQRLDGRLQAWQVSLSSCLVPKDVAITDLDGLRPGAFAIIGCRPSSLVPVASSRLEPLVSCPLAYFPYSPDRNRVPQTEGSPQQDEGSCPSAGDSGLLLLASQLSN